MSNTLSLYECQHIEQQIEDCAAQNDGEVSEEQLQALVEANATSIEKLSGLVAYIRHLDNFRSTGDGEIQRIRGLCNKAKKRLDNIKRFMLPFVETRRAKIGHPIDVGTSRLSTRKSTAVVITDPESFAAGAFPDLSTRKIIYTPDKRAIKERLQKRTTHPGAELEQRTSLIIT